jgi:hypothetical protein
VGGGGRHALRKLRCYNILITSYIGDFTEMCRKFGVVFSADGSIRCWFHPFIFSTRNKLKFANSRKVCGRKSPWATWNNPGKNGQYNRPRTADRYAGRISKWIPLKNGSLKESCIRQMCNKEFQNMLIHIAFQKSSNGYSYYHRHSSIFQLNNYAREHLD